MTPDFFCLTLEAAATLRQFGDEVTKAEVQKMIRCAAFLSLTALLSVNAFAAPTKSLEQSLESVQKIAAGRKDFTLHFKQDFFSSLRKKLQKSQGRLEYSAPRNFRWEVTAPKKELYVNNGKDFWKYTESLRHAQRLPATAAELDFLDAVLNLSSLNNRYVVEPWKVPSAATALPTGQAVPALPALPTEVAGVMSDTPPPRASGQLLVKLIPKAAAKTYALFLVVDEKNAIVQEMRILFQNGNRTRIVFDTFKLEKVNATRFDFVPPPGTAVDKI